MFACDHFRGGKIHFGVLCGLHAKLVISDFSVMLGSSIVLAGNWNSQGRDMFLSVFHTLQFQALEKISTFLLIRTV